MGKWAEIASEPGIVIPLVKKRLLQKNKQPRTSHRPGLYPSELSRDDWCPRATYWRLTGKPEPPRNESFGLTTIFAEGNAIHDKWQGWLREDLWGNWRCPQCGAEASEVTHEERGFCDCCVRPDWEYREVSLESPELMLRGRADGALYPDTLIEFKSVGVGTLRREAPRLLVENSFVQGGKTITDIDGLWRNIKRPMLSHVKQVNIYLHMAQSMGLPFSQAAIVYEFKPNQQSKEFVVKISPEILQPMLDAAARVVYALEHEEPVPCPKGGCADCRAWEAT